ncbi:type 1 fimbrial protein [Pseudomonas baetica]|uniref:fimbrial protein n=1 Tax=Pseudomonas baetica TaxID=674054 RepID=UPI001C8B418D|nr:fimbrial protein [Pseudomonas baetica]MBX9404844.1 type 1 fimbrial protein [Pseudomonas baetica]
MKIQSRLLGCILVVALMSAAAPAMAACTWLSGNNTPKQLTLAAGTVFAPRDVPVGTTLNTTSTARQLNFGDTLSCYVSGTYNTALIGPVAMNIPVDVLNVPSNALLQTNVPGIGLAIYMTGFAASWQPPVGNPNRFIPFNMSRSAPSTATMTQAMMRYALIKTGEIAPGTHTINQLVATGTSDMGPMFDLNFTATVTLAGCSLPAAPGNQIDVPMGNWEKRVFNGKNSTTDAQSFAITLNSCIAGSNYPVNGANAYFTGNFANIQIDGNKTSTIIDAANGILSLSSDSTAQGVAIQVLRDNGTPMNLGQPVQLNRVVNGTTTVPLKARYIQIAEGATPTPGSANGYASFSVTYR